MRSHDNDTKFGMVTRVASGPPTEFMNIHVLIPFDLEWSNWHGSNVVPAGEQ